MTESVDFNHYSAKPIRHKYAAGEPAFCEVIPRGADIDFWKGVGLARKEAHEKMPMEYARSPIEAIPGIRLPGDARDRISLHSFVVDGKRPSDVSQTLDADAPVSSLAHVATS
jgi:cysteine desulfurase / selenocysteine lyase